MPAAQSYKLGKDQTFTFGSMITNANVQSVTITDETSAEAEVTSRGSGDIQEFLPVRKNRVFEVSCFAHSATMHATGVVTVTDNTGSVTGAYYVNSIGEPQEIDNAIVFPITLRKWAKA